MRFWAMFEPRPITFKITICDLEAWPRPEHQIPAHAFTEHGAIMAATVLNNSRAVEMSIYVVRAFVQLRELISSNKDLARRLDQLEARIEKKLVTHDDASPPCSPPFDNS
jgi:hypothetical protein